MRDHEPGSDQAGAVDLSGLRVLRRYALALRQAEAEPAEVLALLRDDLALLESAVDVAAPAAAPPSAPAADAVPMRSQPRAAPSPRPGRDVADRPSPNRSGRPVPTKTARRGRA